MKKYIYLTAIIAALTLGIPAYAACSHQYVKECNYSTELQPLLNNHYYRMKCSLCNDVQVAKTTTLEACTYVNGVCSQCNVAQKIVPIYDINLSADHQNFLYKKCVAYGVEDAYEALIVTMYNKSNFNETLENGLNKGLFQLNSAYDYSWLIGRSNYDLLNAKDNIEIGVALFEYYYELNKEDKWTASVMLNTGCASKEMLEYMSVDNFVSGESFIKDFFNKANTLKYNKILE